LNFFINEEKERKEKRWPQITKINFFPSFCFKKLISPRN
jgi:hypothetical protein